MPPIITSGNYVFTNKSGKKGQPLDAQAMAFVVSRPVLWGCFAADVRGVPILMAFWNSWKTALFKGAFDVTWFPLHLSWSYLWYLVCFISSWYVLDFLSIFFNISSSFGSFGRNQNRNTLIKRHYCKYASNTLTVKLYTPLDRKAGCIVSICIWVPEWD